MNNKKIISLIESKDLRSLLEHENFDFLFDKNNLKYLIKIFNYDNENKDSIIIHIIENLKNTKINFYGYNPLHILARYQGLNIDMINKLMEKEVDFNCYDSDGLAPIHILCLNNKNNDVIKYFIDLEQVDENKRINNIMYLNRHIIHLLGETSNLELVEYVIDKNNQTVRVLDFKNDSIIYYLINQDIIPIDLIKKVLGIYNNINSMNKYGRSPGLLLCDKQPSEETNNLLKYFYDQGLDINIADGNGMSCIHLLCKHFNCEMIDFFMDKGIDLRVKDYNGCTPLHYLCEKSASIDDNNKKYIIIKMIKETIYPTKNICHKMNKNIHTKNIDDYKNNTKNYLLDNNKDIFDPINILFSKNKDGNTPLHLLCSDKDVSVIIKYFINRILSINNETCSSLYDDNIPTQDGADVFGWLMARVLMKDREYIHMFCEENIKGETIIDILFDNKMYDVIKFIISDRENKIIFDKVYKNGNTILHLLCLHVLKIEDIDLEPYMDTSKLEIKNDDGKTPLNILCSCIIQKKVNGYIDIMIEKGADMNTQDNRCLSPLHYLASNNNIDMMRKFIDNGAELYNQDKYGNIFPMYMCNNYVTIDTLRYLMGKMNLEHRTKSGKDMLACLVEKNFQYDGSKFLIDNFKDIETPDEDGWGLIHVATYWSNLEILKYLVEKKVNLKSKTKNGYTILHIACRYSNNEVIKYIIDIWDDYDIQDNEGFRGIDMLNERRNTEMINYLTSKDNMDLGD